MARTYPGPSSAIQHRRPPNNDAPADPYPSPSPDPDPDASSASDNIVLTQRPKPPPPPRGRRRKKTAASKAAPHSNMNGANQTNENRHTSDREATVEQEQGDAFASTIARHLSAQDIDEAATLEAYRSAWEEMRPADSMISGLDRFITNDIETRLDQVVASRARKCNTSDSTWRKIQTCLNNPPWNMLKIHLYAIFGEDCLARTFLPAVRELSMLKRPEDGRSLSLDEAFPVLSQKREQRRSGLARVRGLEQEPQWQAWELKQTIEHFVQEGWVERIKAPSQGGKKKKKREDQYGPSAYDEDTSGGMPESLREHEVARLNKDGSGADSEEADQADTDIENGSVRCGDVAAPAEPVTPERSTTTNDSESNVSDASQADNEETGTATANDGADDDDSDDEREIERGRRASRRSSLHEFADDTPVDFSFASADWETTLGGEGGGTNLVSRDFRDSSVSCNNTGNNDHLDATPLLILPSSPVQRDTTPPPPPRDTRFIEHDNTTTTASAAAAAAPTVVSTPHIVSKSRFVNRPHITTSTMADDDGSASRKRPRTDEPIRNPPLGRDLRAFMQAGVTPALRDELLPGLRACFDIFSVTPPSRSQTAESTPKDDADDLLAPCRLDAPDGSSYIAFLCGMCLVHIPPTSNPAKDKPEATIYVPGANPQAERDEILLTFSQTTGITGLDQEHVRLEELGSGTETAQQIFLVVAKALRAAYPSGNASQVQTQQNVVPSVWRRFLRLCTQRNSVASRLSSDSFMQAFVTFPTVDLASTIPARDCADSPLAAHAATADIATLQKMEAFPEDIEKLVGASEEIRKIVIARLGHVDKEVAPSPSDMQAIQHIENLLKCTQDDESFRTSLENRLQKLHTTARASQDRRKTTLQRLKSALGEDKTDYMDARDAHTVKIQTMKEEMVKAWRGALRRVETACGVGQVED